MEQITLPHNNDAEVTMLASLINYADCFEVTREYLDMECFFDSYNRKVYETISHLYTQNKPTDNLILLMQEFKDRHPKEDENLIADIYTNYTPDYIPIAQLLNQLSMQRKVIQICSKAIADSQSSTNDIADTFSYIRKELDNAEYHSADSFLVDMKQAGTEVHKLVNDNLNGKSHNGIPTPFKEFNDVGGFLLGTLFILAAESGIGKTTLSLNFADFAAQSGYTTAFFSMEMTSADLTSKLVSSRTYIPTSIIENKALTPTQLQSFDIAIGQIQKLPLLLNVKSSWNIDSLCTEIRKLVKQQGVKLVFIDYLQRLNFSQASTKNRTDESLIADSANKLKSLAKELNISIVALSQLSKDYQNPAPDVNRLRGSGQIREIADQIILLYRPEIYEGKGLKYPAPFEGKETHNTAMISFAKGRYCKEFSILAGFNGNAARFYPIDSVPDRQFVDDDEPF